MPSHSNNVHSGGDSASMQKDRFESVTDCGNDYSTVYAASDTASEYAISLDLWLGRVRDGQLPRLYVRQWPGLYDRASDYSDCDEDF